MKKTYIMKSIKIKRIYDPPELEDGYRILIDRLWPRGIGKEEAKLDEWNKNIAPSTELRKWFDHKEERFEEFSLRYQEELKTHYSELERLFEIAKKQNLCLLYGAKNPNNNQAVVLKAILLKLV